MGTEDRVILSVTAVPVEQAQECWEGAGAAYRRREGVVREEVLWERERMAQAVGRRQGRKVARHGMFLLD